MTATNKEIAISYLDAEIRSGGVAPVKKRIKKALKQKDVSLLDFSLFDLEVDPQTQTVTINQDWYACDPEKFTANMFFDLIQSSRSRNR